MNTITFFLHLSHAITGAGKLTFTLTLLLLYGRLLLSLPLGCLEINVKRKTITVRALGSPTERCFQTCRFARFRTELEQNRPDFRLPMVAPSLKLVLNCLKHFPLCFNSIGNSTDIHLRRGNAKNHEARFYDSSLTSLAGLNRMKLAWFAFWPSRDYENEYAVTYEEYEAMLTEKPTSPGIVFGRRLPYRLTSKGFQVVLLNQFTPVSIFSVDFGPTWEKHPRGLRSSTFQRDRITFYSRQLIF